MKITSIFNNKPSKHTKLNNKLLCTLLSTIIMIPTLSLAINKQTKKFTVQDVVLTKNPTAGFNTKIQFKITGDTISSGWTIGFYSAATFKKGSGKNPDLTLNLVDSNGKKYPLVDKPFSGSRNQKSVFSTGTVVVLKEKTDAALKQGTYTLELDGNNQGNPTSYSLAPQSFFLSTKNGANIYNSNPKKSAFTLIAQPNLNQQILAHKKDIWNNSIVKSSDNLNIKYHLVPSVAKISNSPGSINLNNYSGIKILNNDSNNKNSAINFLDKYTKADGVFSNSKSNSLNTIPVSISKYKNSTPAEQYSINIIKNGSAAKIEITANNDSGIFYAVQTLRQLFYYANKNGNQLPILQITDKPRFKYRGILLDVARHYFSVKNIERLTDAMAAEKLNVLHIHFSDDEAFRLSLNALHNKKANPGTRSFPANYFSTMPAYFSQGNLDISNYKSNQMDSKQDINKNYPTANKSYPDNNAWNIGNAEANTQNSTGIYSKDSIKALIKYANARNIIIEPEIDLPAHAYALQHSMAFATDKSPKDKYISVQGFTDDTLPICNYGTGNNKVTKSLDNIIKEINSEFSGQNTSLSKENSSIEHNQISIGGDEVPANAWQNDPQCGPAWPKAPEDKAKYFFENIANKEGIKLSGWQQIVAQDDGSIAKNNQHLNNQQTGYLWIWSKTSDNGYTAAENLINNHYHTVLAFADDSYFDLAYSPAKEEPGFNWANKYSDTEAGLNLAADATKVEQSVNNNKYLDGLEGALWSENMMNFRHLTYMALPKMSGLAEAAWAPQSTTTDTSKISKTNNKYLVNWQSLATRLGCGDGSNSTCKNFLHESNSDGHLNYLYKVVMHGDNEQGTDANFSNTSTYRGYPNGIIKEIPVDNNMTHNNEK